MNIWAMIFKRDTHQGITNGFARLKQNVALQQMSRALQAENNGSTQALMESNGQAINSRMQQIADLERRLSEGAVDAQQLRHKSALSRIMGIFSGDERIGQAYAMSIWKLALTEGRAISKLQSQRKNGAWGSLISALQSFNAVDNQSLRENAVRSFGLWRACVDESRMAVLMDRINELQGTTHQLGASIDARGYKLAGEFHQQRREKFGFSSWVQVTKEGLLRRLDREGKYRQAEQYFVHLIGSRMRRLFAIWNAVTKASILKRTKVGLTDQMEKAVGARDGHIQALTSRQQSHHERLALRTYQRRHMAHGFGTWSRHTAGVMGQLSNKSNVEKILEQKQVPTRRTHPP